MIHFDFVIWMLLAPISYSIVSYIESKDISIEKEIDIRKSRRSHDDEAFSDFLSAVFVLFIYFYIG
jgi:hypothetical protein